MLLSRHILDGLRPAASIHSLSHRSAKRDSLFLYPRLIFQVNRMHLLHWRCAFLLRLEEIGGHLMNSAAGREE
jgi:hypothetical protein